MSILPGFMASHPIHVICWISFASGAAALLVTRLTPPVPRPQLERFAARVQPMGFWGELGAAGAAGRSLLAATGYWLLGTAGIYLVMFGLGFVFRLEALRGTLMLAAGVLALVVMIRGMGAVDRQRRAAGHAVPA